jgi:glycosyltransferase involved in cell wall biosynthesis
MSAVLVQPDSGGRVSGGYLYNGKMAEHGAWDLLNLPAGDLAGRLDHGQHGLVLADSLWLTEQGIKPFSRLRARGVAVGVVLHSFPSMIAAAESGLGVRGEPTPFEFEVLEQFGNVIAPGRHYADLLAGRADVHVLEPGIDDEWRTPPRRRGERCALVSVGAVTQRKGFLDVVQVLEERSRRDDYQWTVVGSLDVDVEYARKVRERAERLGTVVFAGQRSPDETRAIVQRADILVMPSYDENQPLVLLEAMAASVPSVAYAAGAAARMLGDGKAGFVGPVGDRKKLALHLERLMGHEAERHRMAKHCWKRQEKIPSWVTAAQHAKDVLSRVGVAKRA